MGQIICSDQIGLTPVPHKDPFREEIVLLNFEQLMAMIPATSFISFFDGAMPRDFLSLRSREILALNPWLQGRLIRSSDGDIALAYSRDPNSPVTFLEYAYDPSLTDTMTPATSSRVFHLLCKTGLECVGTDLPVFKVTAMQISANKFALIFSNVHCVGDIHTLYSIYAMFSTSSTPHAMVVERDYSFDNHIETAFNEEDIAFMKSPGFLMNMIGNAIFGPKPELHLHFVDLNWVERQKQVVVDEFINSTANEETSPAKTVEFVSTNDVLSSWFYKFSQSDVGTMAVNFRNRDPRWTDRHAGNYISANLIFQKGEYDPRFMRRAMRDGLRPKHAKSPPGIFDGILGAKLCFMSSWVALYKELDLGEECKQTLHFPLKDPNENGPRVPAGNLCFFFRPTKDSVGVCVLTRTLSNDELLREAAISSGENAGVTSNLAM